MKKIIILLLILTVPLKFFGQTTSGTLTADETWTTSMSPVHITGDVTVPNSITLTINPGVTIRFDAGTSLNITGSGTLVADGTSGSQIIFTAYDGTSWGHLNFNNTTSSVNSILDNCIIEHGDARSLSPAYGGGILINSNNLVVSNCTVRNNRSGWGGGVFVNSNRSFSILNTRLYSNHGTNDGGGIYFWNGTNGNMSNCLIYDNSAVGGGGIFFGDDARTVIVYNSTITNNSASNGANVRFMLNNNANRPSLTNCTIWGSNSSISYYGQTPQATDFVNCAIQDPVSGSTTNCVTLNALNTNPAGPNFVATDGSDWSIRVYSPCRDKGTTGSGVPASDILGTSRTGSTDIGAYEVTYKLWNGSVSTDWSNSSNWTYGAPTTISNVVIPTGLTNYPETNMSFQIADLAIESGAFIVIPALAQTTVNAIGNNGELNMFSNSAGQFSLLMNSYIGSGTSEVEIYLTGDGGTNYWNWHYVAVPATYIDDKSVFTNINPYNLLQYDDQYVTTSNYQGWVWHDGYVEATHLLNGPSFNDLIFGKGYNFYHTDDNATATFNVTSLGATLPTVIPQYSGSAPNNHLYGLNLLGNSLTCSINWDNVVKNGNMRNAIYFTKGNQMVSYVNGTGVPGGTTGIIPPLQGFFIKAQSTTGVSIDFSGAGVKTHGNVNRYKGAKSDIPLIRLQMLSADTVKDETLVRFDEKATTEFDNDFDASKLFSSNINSAQLFTQIDNENYVINGIPFPADSYSVPVVIKITETGNYKIKRTELVGLENYSVKLIDKDNNNFSVDLNNTDNYTFFSNTGTFTNRFILQISNVLTGTEEIIKNSSSFNIFYSNNIINIQTLGDDWDGKTGSVKIYDLTGKSISENRNSEFWKNSMIQMPVNLIKGIYIVEMKSGVMRHVGKVVVR